MYFVERRQASLHRLERWIGAALLFDQVVLDAVLLRRPENILPRRHAPAEQHLVSFVRVRRPILAMHRLYAPGIGVDPGNGVRPGFDASAHIQLQHHVLPRVRRQNFHGPLSLDRHKLQLVIVIPRPKTCWFHLLGRGVQRLGDALPPVQVLHSSGACEHDVAASQDVVQLDRVLDAIGAERLGTVVRRIAGNSQIVQQLAHVLRLRGGPVVIRRVEFDVLVSHLCNLAHCAVEILLQIVANGIQLQAHGNPCIALGGGCEWRRGGKSKQRTAGYSIARGHRTRTISHRVKVLRAAAWAACKPAEPGREVALAAA